MLDPLTAVSHTPKLWMGKGRPVSSSTHIHTEDHFLHIHTPQTHLLYRHGFMYSSAAVAPPQPPTAVAPPRRSHSSRRFSRIITRTSLYDLLGVSSSASTADIRSAYRRLAARYHPDVNSSIVAHEKFQALNSAVEVLTTSELRQQYDAKGAAALPGSKYRFLLDFLKQACAQGGGVSSVLGEAGSDLSTVLGLDFNEAVTGSAATVTLDALGPCSDCKGSGFDVASQSADCRVCRGSGEILVRQWTPPEGSSNSSSINSGSSSSSSASSSPMLTLPRSCPACRGSGKSDQQECKRCCGAGCVPVRRKVRFNVPGGVVDGQVLRVKGQGHSGKYGGAPGDLLIKLQVYDLADVVRQGFDLHSVLELHLYEALLGGQVQVRTVRGHRRILVPAGTQHGQLLCIKGAGVPRPGFNGVEYGHHYFEVCVRVPSAAAFSADELKLVQHLAAAVSNNQRRPQQQQRQQHSDMDQLTDNRAQQPSAAAAGDGHSMQQPPAGQQTQPSAGGQHTQDPAAAAFRQHSSDPPLGSFG